MNRRQICLKLGLDILGIPVKRRNWQEIYDAAYLAETRGVHISPARIEFDPKTKHAYSPRIHEDGGHPSRSLYDDILEIEIDLKAGIDDSESYKIDTELASRLEHLKEELKECKDISSLINTS